jgi:NADPH:quinone reductase-like Zn-dependent oxidoreductase
LRQGTIITAALRFQSLFQTKERLKKADWAELCTPDTGTAGSGGTGFIGIEIAKAYGATNIITSTTGAAAIAFVRSLAQHRYLIIRRRISLKAYQITVLTLYMIIMQKRVQLIKHCEQYVPVVLT